MMLGRSRCLLEHDGLDAVFSSDCSRSMSHLLSTYLLFVPVQAIFIAELHPTKILNNRSLLARVELVVTDLLRRMDIIQTRIVEVRNKEISFSSWLTHNSFESRTARGTVCIWGVSSTQSTSLSTLYAPPYFALVRSAHPGSQPSTMTA